MWPFSRRQFKYPEGGSGEEPQLGRLSEGGVWRERGGAKVEFPAKQAYLSHFIF